MSDELDAIYEKIDAWDSADDWESSDFAGREVARALVQYLRASQPHPVPVVEPSNIADAWWPTVEAALELASSQYRGNLGTRALMVAEAADRIPFPFRTKLAIADAQPHPARHNLYGWPERKACGGSGSAHELDADADHGICSTCNGLGLLAPVQNQPHPATGEAGREGPGDDAAFSAWYGDKEQECATVRAAFMAGLARGRDDAEAMRDFIAEVCVAIDERDAGYQARLDGYKLNLRMQERVEAAARNLPASLRPGKGTP